MPVSPAIGPDSDPPSVFLVLQYGSNPQARRAHPDDCTNDVGQFFGRFDSNKLRGALFPPRDPTGKITPLSLQTARDAEHLRQLAHCWQRRVLSGQYCKPPISVSRLSTEIRYCKKPPEVGRGILSCLYGIIDYDHTRRIFYLEAVDPAIYMDGCPFLRYLSLDATSKDRMSWCQGFAEGRTAVGDLLWVHGISPSYQLADSSDPAAVFHEASRLATTEASTDDWTTAFRASSFSYIEPTDKGTRRLVHVAADGITIHGERMKEKYPVSTCFGSLLFFAEGTEI